ncbi:MAG: sugar phosphate nucleotidyltransferase [Dehalococcoidia bacterium]|nr:sugar phosphate nucleotidyltransferase [Dehalococcoidia bacterium]
MSDNKEPRITQAVILAAGKAQRMLPLSKARPKGMICVANQPIIEHIIIEAQQAGINDFILVTGNNGDVIKNYFGDGSKLGVKITYRCQETPSGSGAAVRTVQDNVRRNFIVFNSDMLLSAADIQQLVRAEGITIGVKEVSNPAGFGVVEENDAKVCRILEKPVVASAQMVNTGAYTLNEHIFAAIDQTPLSSRGEIELTQSLQLLIEQGMPVCCAKLESWHDISYPWDLLDANACALSRLISNNQGIIEENVHIEGACNIGTGSIVRAGSYIAGPVVIGENCDIGPNCFIRPATAIGDNCRIGNAVEIKNSIIMRGCKIPHLNYVGDSVIGENCNLGAGTKIANMRFDKEPVTVDGIPTGRIKFGAILGDGVQTGINVSINAGCVIGNHARIWPGVAVYGSVMDDAQLRKEQL